MKAKSSLNALMVLVCLVFVGSATSAFGDTWKLPGKERYCSANKRYCVDVTPRKLESQLKYFQDKVDNKADAGAAKGVKDNHPSGTFYVKSGGGYSRKATFPLVNEVSPVTALISDSGEYFITFDNWHSVGYGDDVVAIYRTTGTLIKKFGLEELLTEGDIESFPRSVSSMNWGGDHYLDNNLGLLVLKLVANGRNPWEADARFRELKIAVATAQPLEAKRDLLPHRVFVTAIDITAAGVAAEPAKPPVSRGECLDTFESANIVRIPFDQFYAKAKAHPLPTYPPIAKMAHAEGTVIVEILARKAGEVVCVRALSGHPILQAAATAAALKWQFEPFEIAGGSRISGVIAMTFRLEVRDVDPPEPTSK